MLTLEVDSSIREVVEPPKVKDSYYQKFLLEPNKENRHLFQQGILLRLMGERVSLYAESADDVWLEQRNLLDEFLSKVEIKVRTRVHAECVDIMSFEQHRKSGVVCFPSYIAAAAGLTQINGDVSRLNPTYAQYVKNGLFDGFVVDDETFYGACSVPLSDLKAHIHRAIDTCLSDESSFTNDKSSRLTISGANKLIEALSSIFNGSDEISVEEGTDYFLVLRNILLENKKHHRVLTDKKKGLSVDKTMLAKSDVEALNVARRSLDTSLFRFAYFALNYLRMYVDLHKGGEKTPNCASFGVQYLDFKSKSGLKLFMSWIDDEAKAFTRELKMDASTEFYKSAFTAPTYGVSTSAPVPCRRYDGKVDLFISSDAETESYIKERIINSGCWNIRVGKKGLARLESEPVKVPSQYWSKVQDDVLRP